MTSNPHSAEGTIAGFDYQFIRALYFLSRAQKGATVGIETEDDVVSQDHDGKLILEQNKHSLRENDDYHPLGDGSYALWNTLKNWLKYIEENPGVEVSFFLTTNKSVKIGYVLELDAANTR